ncbi:3146_t:CDS:2 [Funneliformis caledonium]|uniref:ADP-ribosylation factor-like protein 6-interacting protein 4 n=1 Tax=Funneliformis caledonium TaxID=1117310 RepID=A0A9N9C8H5_9GLOM|nr:3146_t:CDS:2 [Funneliformis caledonium]
MHRSRSPIRSSSYSHYRHSKESHNKERNYSREREQGSIDYSTDTTNSANSTDHSSKDSTRYHHHKSKSKKKRKKHKKHKKKKHEEKDPNEVQLFQEIREWQQKLRMKKEPIQSSSITIQEEEEIEKRQKRPSMMPQTQKEYEAERSVIKEVIDPVDGRVRLIRGSGEILERIVSREEHKRINIQATMGDALTYQKKWMSDAR